jgi:hypothetical protein
MLQQVVSYIQSQTSLTLGVDLFAGDANLINVDHVTIYDSPGTAPDFDLPDRIDAMIQIIAHYENYIEARDKANEIANLFHGNCGITLPIVSSGETQLQVSTGQILNGPYSLGYDSQQKCMVSINLLLVIQNL